MPEKIQMDLKEFVALLRLGEKNRGKEFSIAFLQEEINKQPAAFYDALCALVEVSLA